MLQEIQVREGGGVGGKKTTPSIGGGGGVWIFSGITQYSRIVPNQRNMPLNIIWFGGFS